MGADQPGGAQGGQVLGDTAGGQAGTAGQVGGRGRVAELDQQQGPGTAQHGGERLGHGGRAVLPQRADTAGRVAQRRLPARGGHREDPGPDERRRYEQQPPPAQPRHDAVEHLDDFSRFGCCCRVLLPAS